MIPEQRVTATASSGRDSADRHRWRHVWRSLGERLLGRQRRIRHSDARSDGHARHEPAWHLPVRVQADGERGRSGELVHRELLRHRRRRDPWLRFQPACRDSSWRRAAGINSGRRELAHQLRPLPGRTRPHLHSGTCDVRHGDYERILDPIYGRAGNSRLGLADGNQRVRGSAVHVTHILNAQSDQREAAARSSGASLDHRSDGAQHHRHAASSTNLSVIRQ